MIQDKQEYWWVYISDRKSRTLLTSPYHVTALVEEDEVQLKFTAPRWPGVFTFTVCLRSDSYLGFDQTHDIKVSFELHFTCKWSVILCCAYFLFLNFRFSV
jgi:translocation protein SEC63